MNSAMNQDSELSVTNAEPMATLFTPRGRGAVATICCRGAIRHLDQVQPPLFQAVNGKPFSEQKINQILFGQWGSDPSEDVVVCRTAQETLEIHCHGGQAAVNRILAGLEKAGCRIVPWQEFQTIEQGPFQTELQNALAQATTFKTASFLLEQQSGILEQKFQELLDQIKRLSDVPEDDLLSSLQSELRSLVEAGRLGRHLIEPFQVVLAGRPNVGKSSLINALVGYDRSIVYDMPGTTRDAVSTSTAFNGWPVELTDTAGLRQTDDQLESAGIEIAQSRLEQADCRILLFDVSQPLTQQDYQLKSEWPDAILVAHKVDLAEMPQELKEWKAIPVSSTVQTGIEELIKQLEQKLVPQDPLPGTPLPFTERQTSLLERALQSVHNQEWKSASSLLNKLIS